MRSFESGKAPPADGDYDTVDTPTYLLARDEDCENSFHSTADFVSRPQFTMPARTHASVHR